MGWQLVKGIQSENVLFLLIVGYEDRNDDKLFLDYQPVILLLFH